MILGPGGYRYRDFLRVGTPLAVLLLGVSLLLIPALWPFLPA
jgi:di/tricarboxylate transporter